MFGNLFYSIFVCRENFANCVGRGNFMIVVYGFLIVGYLILWWKARKKGTTVSTVLWEAIGDSGTKASQRKAIKQLYAVLYNERRVKELATEEAVHTMKRVVQVVMGGTILSTLLWFAEHSESDFIKEYEVKRNQGLEGSYSLETMAYIGEETYEIPIDVLEEQYTLEELEDLYTSYLIELENTMIGENQFTKKVTTDLYFPTSLSQYPFVNEWSTSDYATVDSQGKIHQEDILENGKAVSIFVKSRYLEFEKVQEFSVVVYPRELGPKEQVAADLEEAILQHQELTKEQGYMSLPSTYKEEAIIWKLKNQYDNGYALLFSLVIAVLLYLQNQKNQKEKLRKREEQLLFDYATIVNQITLYLGAGMTLRKCFQKMVQDYSDVKVPQFRYAYEELKNLCQELESGTSENVAYENLGRRCDNRTYLKFTSMLSQNIRKGSSDLLNSLKREVVVAGEEHKAAVRMKAEQATTKLLIPMVMMLGVVMIMIMVPAFMSFQL